MRIPLGPLLAASLLVASLGFVAGGAEAVNWCPNVTVTVSPPIYTPNVPSSYTFLVVNSGTSDLNLTGVTVRFSFETSDRVLSSANVTVRTGTPKSFETPSITGPSGGSVTVTIKLDGYPVNQPSDAGRCTKTATLQTVDTTGFFSSILIAILVLAVIVVVVVVIVVVVVVVAAKKKPPQAPPYQPYPPPYGPPPAAQPPGGPPQQPPTG